MGILGRTILFLAALSFGTGCASVARGLLEGLYQKAPPLREAASAIDLLTGDTVDLDTSDREFLTSARQAVEPAFHPPRLSQLASMRPGDRVTIRITNVRERIRAMRLLELPEDWVLVARRRGADGIEEWQFLKLGEPGREPLPAGWEWARARPIDGPYP